MVHLTGIEPALSLKNMDLMVMCFIVTEKKFQDATEMYRTTVYFIDYRNAWSSLYASQKVEGELIDDTFIVDHVSV